MSVSDQHIFDLEAAHSALVLLNGGILEKVSYVFDTPSQKARVALSVRTTSLIDNVFLVARDWQGFQPQQFVGKKIISAEIQYEGMHFVFEDGGWLNLGVQFHDPMQGLDLEQES